MAKGKKQRRVAEGKLRLIVGGATSAPPGPPDSGAASDPAPRSNDEGSGRPVVRLVRAGAAERNAERARDARPSRPAVLRHAATPARSSVGREPERVRDLAADDALERDSLVLPKKGLFARVPTVVYVVAIAAVAATVIAILVARSAPKIAPPTTAAANVTVSPSAVLLPNAPDEMMSAAATAPSSSAR